MSAIEQPQKRPLYKVERSGGKDVLVEFTAAEYREKELRDAVNRQAEAKAAKATKKVQRAVAVKEALEMLDGNDGIRCEILAMIELAKFETTVPCFAVMGTLYRNLMGAIEEAVLKINVEAIDREPLTAAVSRVCFHTDAIVEFFTYMPPELTLDGTSPSSEAVKVILYSLSANVADGFNKAMAALGNDDPIGVEDWH